MTRMLKHTLHISMMLLFAVTLAPLLTACSLSAREEAPEAYISREVSVQLPKPCFEYELSKEELLTTTYSNQKKSVMVLLDIKKDSLELVGMSTGYIKLFSVLYTQKALEVSYHVPKTFLPPVNQVLLDILLCHNQDLAFLQKESFILTDTKDKRTVTMADGKILYIISYRFFKDLRLPVKIENKEFNYSIDIKYLN